LNKKERQELRNKRKSYTKRAQLGLITLKGYVKELENSKLKRYIEQGITVMKGYVKELMRIELELAGEEEC